MPKIPMQKLFFWTVVAAGCLALGYVFSAHPSKLTEADEGKLLKKIPFDGRQAYKYLEQICNLGTRISGSAEMRAQQSLLIQHFTELGAEVHLQEFKARHPQDGSEVPMANLIVHWHPDKMKRILLCTHYDTRPYPDRDPDRPRGRFLGANDGASGTALLMELGKKMKALDGPYGVDFVFFDGEELIYPENNDIDLYFLGSKHFARDYRAGAPSHQYRFGVLLDMVGDKDLQIYHERNSASWPEVRPLIGDIWGTAQRLGVREFVARKKHDVRDDHFPLYYEAGIPVCNIIDFDFPFWHTEKDTPMNCSALSLARVGWVLEEWLKSVR